MKIWLQLVALGIVTLLAIPPALAELCLAPQSSQMECCADSGSNAMRPSSHRIELGTPAALAQACDEGCCFVSPPSTPIPSAPEKATVGGSSLVQDSPSMGLVVATEAPLWHDGSEATAAIDRQILLHVFRI